MSVINSNPIIDDLLEMWRRCGINSGDTVLLHSDVKRILMHYNYFNQPNDSKKEKVLSVNDILDSFFLAIGAYLSIAPVVRSSKREPNAIIQSASCKA